MNAPQRLLAALAALAAGACGTAPSDEAAKLEAPVVGVSSVAAPNASPTLSTGLNTTTTERVATAPPASAPSR